MAGERTLKVNILGDSKQAQQAFGGLGQKADSMGAKIGKFAKVASMAAAGGIAALGTAAVGAAFKTAEAGDTIAKAARTASIATDTFQELRFAFGQAGISTENFDSSMRRLNRRLGLAAEGGGPAIKAFEMLDIAVRDSNGAVRETGDVLDEALPKLAAIESDAQRAALASQLFGEDAGPGLAAALADGGEGIDAAREKAHELGIVLSGDALDSAEKFSDGWDDIKQRMQGFLFQAGIPVMGFLADKLFPFISGTALPILGRFADWLGPKIEDAVGITLSVFRSLITWTNRLTDELGFLLGLDPGQWGNAWQGALVIIDHVVSEISRRVRQAIQNIPAMMERGGRNAVLAYAQGIIDGASVYVTQAVNYVADLVAAYLVGQSPPKKGPLREIERGGRNTMAAYVAGLIDGARGATKAADEVVERLDDINASAELRAGREGLRAAQGDLESMEQVAEDVDGKLAAINRTIQEIDLNIAAIDREIEAINDAYDDQLQPLEEQLELLEKQRDLQAERLQLETDLAQAQANAAKLAALGDPERRAEIAGDMELLDIEQERLKLEEDIADTRAKLEGGGKALTDEERNRLELKERQLELSRRETVQKLKGDKELTDLEKERLQLKLDQLDADIAANRAEQDAEPEKLTEQERKQLELQLQEMELRKELVDMIDEEAKAQAEADSAILDAREKERELTEQIADTQRDIAKLPIEEEIAKVEEARRKELEPLKEQKALLQEQKDDLSFQRQQWQLLATDVNAALTPMQEAAREAERLAKEMERAEKAAGGLGKARAGGGGGGQTDIQKRRLAGEISCPPGEVMLEDGSCRPISDYTQEEIEALGLSRHAPGGGAGTAGGGGGAGAGEAPEDLVLPEIKAMGDGGAVAPEGLDIPPLPGEPGSDVQPEDQKPMGEQFGTQFADGFLKRVRELIEKNMGRILGASIGGAIGGGIASLFGLGPVGAAIGGSLGGLIGGNLQEALEERGIDLSRFQDMIETRLGPVLEGVQGIIDEHVMPALDRFLDWFEGDGQSVIGKFIDWLSTDGIGIFQDFIDFLTEHGRPAFKEVSEFVGELMELIAAGEWREAGTRIGELLRGILVGAIEIASDLAPKIGEALGELVNRIDWLGFGKKVAPAAALFVIGFVDALTDPVVWLKVFQEAWLEITLLLVGIILAPARFLRPIVQALRRIPLAGRFLAWFIENVHDFGRRALKPIGDVLSSIARAFFRGFGSAFDEGGPGLFRSIGRLLDDAIAFVQLYAEDFAGRGILFVERMGRTIAEHGPKQIHGAFRSVLDGVGRILFDWIPTVTKQLIRNLGEWGSAFISWVGPAGGKLVLELGTLYLRVQRWILTDALPKIIRNLAEWAWAFIAWVGPAIPKLIIETGKLQARLTRWVLTEALPKIVTSLLEWGRAFIAWVGPAIPKLIIEAGKLSDRLMRWVTQEALPQIVKSLKEWGLAFIAWIGDEVLPRLADELGKILRALRTWATETALPAIKAELKEWAEAFLDWVGENVIPDLPDRLDEIMRSISRWVTNNIKKARTLLVGIGAAVITGFWDGLKGKWKDVEDWFDDVTDSIPLKKGPPEKDKKLLKPSGEMIMEGLEAGIQSKARDVERTLANVTEGLAVAGMTNVNGNGLVEDNLMARQAAASGPREIRIPIYLFENSRQLQEIVVDAINGRARVVY